MLNISKVNINNSFKSNYLSNQKTNSFGNNAEAREAYLEMNKDVYQDFVGGDISLSQFIGGKFKKLWAIITDRYPNAEMKAKIYEQTLLNNAAHDEDYAVHDIDYAA